MAEERGRLAGRVALISGAARGQGAAEAKLFVSEGANVAVADVLDDEGGRLAEELGATACYLHLDVGDEGQWSHAVGATVERFGKLDALVNNAGIYRPKRLLETTLDDYLNTVRVNQVGVFLGMRAALQPMIAAGGGSIVNVSSTAGFLPSAGSTAYAATKFSVRGMSRVAAAEFGAHGIRVNSVYPGAVETPMLAGVDTSDAGKRLPLGRIGRAEEIASVVLFLISEESSFCTGAEFVADGGLLTGPVFT
jgi:3alpha(or 20beta)-hydroxysteroid dehydrogenase